MATVRDVARACGRSIATVSRVFNGSANVSEETRARVRKAAEKLDYYPNSAARSLTTSRTHTIGVLLPDLYGEFFSEVIRGLDYAARQASLHILLSSAHNDGEALLAAARSLRGRVDGLVDMPPDSGSAEANHRIATQFPVVLL
ncbi:MAG: LacI family DNA-binding transcriptional regulator, partial [Candidatus Eisenbacteria bacterium]|nr:LacI family DNA-binding transcriptional regulator [Candidatus Eisenbacteria bacterium]